MTTEQRTPLQRAWILLTKPLAVAAFRRRHRRRFNRNYPIIWRTPGEIISLDLENYDSEDDGIKLDKAFIDDLVPARDAALARANSLTLLNFIVFGLLAADYLSLGVKFSIPGVAVEDIKGVREFLLFFTGVVGAIALIAQSNIYTMDSAIKFVITNRLPEALQSIYLAKYFSHENIPRFVPTNIPHITVAKSNSVVTTLVYLGWGAAIVIYLIFYLTIGIMIAIDIWKSAGLGLLSRVVAVGYVVNAILCWGYLITTRAKMPYRDYFRSQEIEVLSQIAPSQVEAKRSFLYDESNGDYARMVERGYFTGNPQKDYDHAEARPARFIAIALIAFLIILILV
ncbi:hypothetical protein [Neorhizobium sp. T25_13]|uniref:hypothetical protein n=1 Tax=Neorhizobium sp. T25_13 TaxID=2093830 RepID=UPI000CF8BE8D|nr:hypothetical protein [Neorhizobium sp. T25_13]